ncbi:hypothetical protein CAPTEDRAFT_219423 [Capitella teleta]|uniref:Amidohydrolase-related domain-containing protein n=1 Tax=Capitella teleta TaxID=283909 RepID=R7TTN2_CAPTE|nr:hypothetical protein CAPTEDRAFT_219423 [Capitella teleta]|eukprot:ELT97044.1 hypothetical protein CAPTEDRAFT_219423 [Capitella teleta]
MDQEKAVVIDSHFREYGLLIIYAELAVVLFRFSTDWILNQAENSKVIGGVIGGVDLMDHNLPNILEKYASNPRFVGVRHILDTENDDWLLRPDVLNGFKLLEERGLVFDLLVRPRHLQYAIQVAKYFPKYIIIIIDSHLCLTLFVLLININWY